MSRAKLAGVAAALWIALALPAAGASGDFSRGIETELDREAGHERLWWSGWTLAYGGLTVGQSVAAGLVGDRDTRADMGVGAVTSLLGVVGMLTSPLPAVDEAARLLRAMPEETADERSGRDQAASALREQAASAERAGRSWLAHALNFAVAAGSSLVLWKGFDRGASSAANFATSLAIGELQIWTQPAALIGKSSTQSIAFGWNGRLLRVVLAF